MSDILLQITQAIPAGAVFESLIKYAGGLIAIGTVIFIAGKVAQAVDYLKATVELLKQKTESHEIKIENHSVRIGALEERRKR